MAIASVLVAVAQTPGTQATPPQSSLDSILSSPQTLASNVRLERTPRLDGVFRADEWDILWGSLPAPSMPAVQPTSAPSTNPQVPVSGTPPPSTSSNPPLVPPASSTPTTTRQLSATEAKTVQTQATGVVPSQPQPVSRDTTPPPVQPVTFMNWEPGKLYVAALVPPSSDMIVSLDGASNSFSVGEDNLEIRVTPGAPPKVRARLLTAFAGAGPAWHESPAFLMSTTAVSGTGPQGTTYIAVCIEDPGVNILPIHLKGQFGARVDVVPTTAPETDAVTTRAMAIVSLDDQRFSGLPSGISAVVGDHGRSIAPGDLTSIRWVLSGKEGAAIHSIDIAGEGPLNELVNSLHVPDPWFDQHSEIVVDYPTRLAREAVPGYDVIQARVTGNGWGSAVVEGSLRVIPPIDIVASAKTLRGSAKEITIGGQATLVSGVTEKVDGLFEIVPPTGWRVVPGSNRNFIITKRNATSIRGFRLIAPAGTRGTFRATIRVTALRSTFTQPYWITIL